MADIIVVDDEHAILEVVDEALTDDGHRIARATNGAECLALLNGYVPDLILSDIMMPGIDGRELCRRLSAHPRYRSIPVVIMSAVGNKPKIDGCQYTAFLAKPFLLSELYGAIDAVLTGPQSDGAR